MPRPRLLIATHNQGKMREYRHLLGDVPLELVSLDDLGISEEIAETGTTFAENAWLKAGGYAGLSGMLTLSDDSGLEVDALGGAPGIHSARYGGGADTSDEERVQLLLRNLAGVPWEKRTARFRCVIAICSLEERKASVVGSVSGMIQYKVEGNEGFGYDPVFYLPSYGRTMSQIPLSAKNRISHRSDAAGRAAAVLKQLAETGSFPPD
jgi:XTP/dITP diphosphohydrolase